MPIVRRAIATARAIFDATQSAHSYADVGTLQHGRIVDAVADERKRSIRFLLVQQVFYLRNLIRRQQACVIFFNTYTLCYVLSHLIAVARKHNGALNANLTQCAYSLG